MSTKITYIRNGTPVNPPNDWQGLEVELNFDKDAEEANQQLSINNVEWVRENATASEKYIQDGLTTGVGVFEGEPLDIELTRNGITETLFKGYLDYASEASFGPIRSNIKIVESGSIDWLNETADSFTFSHLFSIGQITKDDFIYMPYVLTTVPNYRDAAIATLSVYVMVKEIKDAIQKLVEFVSDLPIYYVFSTYVKLILYIIFLIILIVALIKLIKSVILLIIQPVKYHAGMKIIDQLRKGAEFLGCTISAPDFESGIYKDATIIPEKYYNPKNKKEKQILGFTDPDPGQEGFFKGTFGDLLRACKTMINGKVICRDGKITLVRRDFNTSAARYVLKPVEKQYTDLHQRQYSLNTQDFKSNYYLKYQTDSTDKNTLQEFLGTSYQVILQPQRANNSTMVLMRGLEEINVPFALAKRKEELTVPEDILNGFLKVFGSVLGALVTVVNAIIEVLNIVIALVNKVLDQLATIGIKIKFRLPDIPKVKLPDFKNIFSNRIGMLKLEADLFSVPKVFILVAGGSPKYNKISEDNAVILSGRKLWDDFYHINSFLPTNDNPNGNQYYLPEPMKCSFSFEDFLLVKDDNKIFDDQGNEGIIYSLKWNPWNQIATIKYGINKAYTNNLRLTDIEPDGK